MYKWFAEFHYTNYLGDKIETYLPIFNSYNECTDFLDTVYLHVLQYNHVSNFVGYCDWIKV